MAADAAGNDLSAAKIVVTSAFCVAPYDATQKLTANLIAPTVAEDNDITRQLTIGKPDSSGVYHVTDVIQNGKWFCYQETVFKNGTHRRRLGVVNLTGNEQGQDKAGVNTGDAWTIEWIQDDVCDSGNSKYLESFVTPTVSSGSHATDHQADDSESQPVAD